MNEYNIYTGLSGGFGGAKYHSTILCNNLDEAEEYAWELACQDYEEYCGCHGLRTWEDIAMEEMTYDEDLIGQIYNSEMEYWIDYYAKLTSEDDLEEDELIREHSQS